MSAISVTYTFINGTTADASQVNQNFSDIINGTSDGTKDLAINAITASGSATLNGNVTLGVSSSKTLTINASLSSSIPIGTNNSYDIGSSTLGLASVYLGSAGGLTTRLIGGATGSSWSMTLPTTTGTNSFSLVTNGSGVTTWGNVLGPNSKVNYGLAASVSASALTIALKDAAGNDPSAASPVYIPFRSATAATGTTTTRAVTSALSVVISSGSTLGHVSGQLSPIFVYAIDNAGTVELAASAESFYDEATRQTTTAEGGGGAADSANILYSTTSRSNVGIRLLGRLKSSQATAGTWASAISEISTTLAFSAGQRCTLTLKGGGGHGSINNKIRIFSSPTNAVGTGLFYATSATLGDIITILEAGVYSFCYTDTYSAGSAIIGISRNSTDGTTSIASIAGANVFGITNTIGATQRGFISLTFPLDVGDTIRAHTDGQPDATIGANIEMQICKISD